MLKYFLIAFVVSIEVFARSVEEAYVDYYAVLGVEKTASSAEIRSAYRKLALKYHPDHSDSAKEKFSKISKAYHILSDKESRAQYDETGRSTEVDPFAHLPQVPFGFYGRPPEYAPPPIYSSTHSLGLENWRQLVQWDGMAEEGGFPAWLVYFYVDFDDESRRLSSLWENTARKLKGIVHTGRVDCYLEPRLCFSARVHHPPAIVIFWANGTNQRPLQPPEDGYNLQFLVSSVSEVLPQQITIITDSTYQSWKQWDPHKSKIVIVGSSGYVPPKCLWVAFDLSSDIDFGYINFANNDAKELLTKWGVDSPNYGVVLQDFPNEDEENVIKLKGFDVTKLHRWSKKNRFLKMPKITMNNYENLCGKRSKKRIQFCLLLLLGNQNQNWTIWRNALLKLGTNNKKSPVQIGWINGEKQDKWLQCYTETETIEDRPLLMIQKNDPTQYLRPYVDNITRKDTNLLKEYLASKLHLDNTNDIIEELDWHTSEECQAFINERIIDDESNFWVELWKSIKLYCWNKLISFVQWTSTWNKWTFLALSLPLFYLPDILIAMNRRNDPNNGNPQPPPQQ